jgi:hypothetical protein
VAEEQQQEGSGAAFQELAQALRETFTWLGRTLNALFETLRSLLQAVGLLLRALLMALSEGLGAAGQPSEAE